MNVNFEFTDAEVTALAGEGYTPEDFIRRRLDDLTGVVRNKAISLVAEASPELKTQFDKVLEAIASEAADKV